MRVYLYLMSSVCCYFIQTKIREPCFLDYILTEVLSESEIPNVPKVEVGQTCQSIESIWR